MTGVKEEFLILDGGSDEDFLKWLSIYNSWVSSEPFAHPAYCKLFCDDKTHAQCAILISSFGIVMYPFLSRDIKKEAFSEYISDDAKDIITPYGYGGQYIISFSDKNKLSEVFNHYFKSWVQSENVVCEVIKFHLFEEDVLPYSGSIVSPQSNIVVDLTANPDDIWHSFDYKVRKNVKKAQRSNLKFVADPNGKYIDEFLNIYYQTMDRRSAKENYYFNAAFFKTIIEQMPDHFHFFHIFLNDQMISTELCMISNHHMYSFLGGTLSDYFELRPNDLLKYEIILWGIEHKKKRFVLGGGYQDNDGIFKYKKSFAPQGTYRFNIGTCIYDQKKYDLIVKAKSDYLLKECASSWEPVKGFVPEYRT